MGGWFCDTEVKAYFLSLYIWRFQNNDNSDLSWFQFLSIWDGDGMVIDTRYEVDAGHEDRMELGWAIDEWKKYFHLRPSP